MPAGLEIINTSGSVLIDENYANLAVSASGTLTFSSDGTQNISLPYYANGLRNPIIALRVTGSGGAGVRNTTRNNVAMTATAVIYGKAGANVSWWSFDMPQVVSSSGLQIYNSAGILVFDSGNKYARVVDYWMPANNSAWKNAVKTYANGRTMAVAYCSPWWYKSALQSTSGCGGSQTKYRLQYEGMMSRVTTLDNSFTFTREIYRDEGSFGECTANDPRSRTGQPVIAFVDVTGY